MLLDDVIIENVFLEKIVKNREYNELIQIHYERLHKEMKDDKLRRKRDSLKDCNALWILDKYEIAKVKDFKKLIFAKISSVITVKKLNRLQGWGNLFR
ncbi:repB domain protein [Bacillus cereus]|nr:repB domain protein [Bacillus cereus]